MDPARRPRPRPARRLPSGRAAVRRRDATRSARLLLLAAVAAAVCLPAASRLAGQTPDTTGDDDPRGGRPIGVTDRNGHPFRTPAASPLEGIHRIAVVSTDRDTLRQTVAFADLADKLGFWIHRSGGTGAEIAGAIHGGAYSRFSLEGPDNEFLEIHYRLGFLVRARMGGLAARLELYHVSSHLGDELQARTGLEPISTSREGAELLFQASPLDGLSIYGGPGLLLRTSQDFGRGSLRAGAEWTSDEDGRVAAYGSFELFSWEERDWTPALAFEAGARLGRHARLGLIAGSGPSRAEQFFRDDETVFGLSISYMR